MRVVLYSNTQARAHTQSRATTEPHRELSGFLRSRYQLPQALLEKTVQDTPVPSPHWNSASPLASCPGVQGQWHGEPDGQVQETDNRPLCQRDIIASTAGRARAALGTDEPSGNACPGPRKEVANPRDGFPSSHWSKDSWGAPLPLRTTQLCASDKWITNKNSLKGSIIFITFCSIILHYYTIYYTTYVFEGKDFWVFLKNKNVLFCHTELDFHNNAFVRHESAFIYFPCNKTPHKNKKYEREGILA